MATHTQKLTKNFNPSPSYSAHKSSNHNLPQIYQINLDTNLYQTKHTYTHKRRTQNFRRIGPFGIAPVKKSHTARTRWYRGPFGRFINTREWTEAIKKKLQQQHHR